MRITEGNAGMLAALLYTSGSLLAALLFTAAAVATGSDWVDALGGFVWVFILAMIILMTTVTPLVTAKATGRRVEFTHDHDAMLRQEQSKARAMVKDPVCGMEIDPTAAAGSSVHNGQTYYFCNLNCKKSFDRDPKKYAGAGHA